jgi:hypothetical protein
MEASRARSGLTILPRLNLVTMPGCLATSAAWLLTLVAMRMRQGLAQPARPGLIGRACSACAGGGAQAAGSRVLTLLRLAGVPADQRIPPGPRFRQTPAPTRPLVTRVALLPILGRMSLRCGSGGRRTRKVCPCIVLICSPPCWPPTRIRRRRLGPSPFGPSRARVAADRDRAWAIDGHTPGTESVSCDSGPVGTARLQSYSRCQAHSWPLSGRRTGVRATIA